MSQLFCPFKHMQQFPKVSSHTHGFDATDTDRNVPNSRHKYQLLIYVATYGNVLRYCLKHPVQLPQTWTEMSLLPVKNTFFVATTANRNDQELFYPEVSSLQMLERRLELRSLVCQPKSQVNNHHMIGFTQMSICYLNALKDLF